MGQFTLLRQRKFSPLFWTQFSGAFNDNFLKNALVILLTYKSVSVLGIPPQLMVAAAGGIFILPFFLFSATSGQIADKYEKTKIVRIIKLVEILIMVLATIGFLTEQYGFLLLTLFFMGLHSTFFGPIKYSILPQHLNETELVAGNALVEAGTFLAILLGTIAGGMLISVKQYGSEIVSFGLLVVAVAGYLFSTKIPKAESVAPGIRVVYNPITPTRDILRFAKKDRGVFLSILGISWFWYFGATVLSLFPSLCRDVLHANETVVTMMLATFSIGIGLGSMLCEKLSRRTLELGLVPIGSIGISLFSLDLFFVGSHISNEAAYSASTILLDSVGMRLFVDLLLLSILSGLFIVPLYTFIQERSEKSHRSRIIAANNIWNALFMVVSAIVTMILIKIGVTIFQMFLILAVLNALVAFYIYTVVPEFLYRLIVWVLAHVMYRLRVSGRSHIPKSGAAIVVCNHVSFFDAFLLAAAVPRPMHYVMDHIYFKGALVKKVLTQAQVMPIATAKENPEILEKAYDRIRSALRAGDIVCIFPEGVVTRDGNLGEFRPGVLKILNEVPVPVIPVGIKGMWGSIFSRKWKKKYPRRFWAPVEIHISEPIAPIEVTLSKLETKVRQIVE